VSCGCSSEDAEAHPNFLYAPSFHKPTLVRDSLFTTWCSLYIATTPSQCLGFGSINASAPHALEAPRSSTTRTLLFTRLPIVQIMRLAALQARNKHLKTPEEGLEEHDLLLLF